MTNVLFGLGYILLLTLQIQITSANIMFDSTDTTDVQRVKAILSILLEAKSIIVCCQCDFITGSNAKGCKVVLVGQSLNHPMSFTKQNISTTSIMGNYSLGYEKFCKHDIVQVMAYDIEENGIEGNVTVPGSVEWSSNSENNLQQLCNQTSGIYVKPSWSL